MTGSHSFLQASKCVIAQRMRLAYKACEWLHVSMGNMGVEGKMEHCRFLALAGLAAVLAISVPQATTASEARPTADEQCIAQCDTTSDQCMAEAGGDENKQQACDDRYTECLNQCR